MKTFWYIREDIYWAPNGWSGTSHRSIKFFNEKVSNKLDEKLLVSFLLFKVSSLNQLSLTQIHMYLSLIKEPNYSLLLVITFVWRSVRKKQTMLFLKLLLRNKSLPMFLVHSQTSSQVFYFLLWKVLYLFHSCFCPSEMVETDNLHFLCSVTSDVFASWSDIILGVILSLIKTILPLPTAQKIKFSIEDFYSKSDQIRRKLRIWSHLL